MKLIIVLAAFLSTPFAFASEVSTIKCDIKHPQYTAFSALFRFSEKNSFRGTLSFNNTSNSGYMEMLRPKVMLVEGFRISSLTPSDQPTERITLRLQEAMFKTNGVLYNTSAHSLLTGNLTATCSRQ